MIVHPDILQLMYIPEFLFAEIEAQVLADKCSMTLKVPAEDSDNKQNINR